MDVIVAGDNDLEDLTRLLWLFASLEEQERRSPSSFATELAGWWDHHRESHVAFVARLGQAGAVGVAWLAFVPRTPRPGEMTRLSAEIQSVFVLPEHRGKRIGTALVQAACEEAIRLGAGRLTVHSGDDVISFYERLGFASSAEFLAKPLQ